MLAVITRYELPFLFYQNFVGNIYYFCVITFQILVVYICNSIELTKMDVMGYAFDLNLLLFWFLFTPYKL